MIDWMEAHGELLRRGHNVVSEALMLAWAAYVQAGDHARAASLTRDLVLLREQLADENAEPEDDGMDLPWTCPRCRTFMAEGGSCSRCYVMPTCPAGDVMDQPLPAGAPDIARAKG